MKVWWVARYLRTTVYSYSVIHRRWFQTAMGTTEHDLMFIYAAKWSGLHWLAVKARIQFKVATVIHATLNQRGPAYLNNIIKFNTEESGRRHLRSSTTNAAVVMRIEDTDPVWEARLLRLRSKYLEPDSSSHQEPSFCPGFSQSPKDLFVFGAHL